jgi:S1-C subfamily serine protease
MDGKNSGWKSAVIVLLIVFSMGIAILGGGLAGGAAGYYMARRSIPTTAPAAVAEAAAEPTAKAVQKQPKEQPKVPSVQREATSDVEGAVKAVQPAVVTVINTLDPSVASGLGIPLNPGDESPTASGSGVIISRDGYILTNNHVVENQQALEVVFSDGSKAPATLVGTDLFADLAVLKVDGSVPATAPLGDSAALQPGQTVIAMGSPLGEFTNTVTVGVVSAVNRQMDTGQGYALEGMIQTDAAINSGNSGGPLVNLAGEVVGLNTMVVRGSALAGASAEGLGFAIPANTIADVSKQIMEKGYVSRPYLGIRYQLITPDIAAANDLPVEWGIYVEYVEPGLAADQAGLSEGDIIVALGSDQIGEDTQFVNLLLRHQPGDRVELSIVRDGNDMTVEATLGERPQAS